MKSTSDPTATGAPLVIVGQGLEKRYGGTMALRGVDFELWPAEVHVLLGENGAGKSTLAKVFAGAVHPDAGELRLDEVPVAFGSPRDAKRAGIALVHQELSLVPQMTVAENLLLGNEATGRVGIAIDRKAGRERTRKLLGFVGLDLPPDTPVGVLSWAEKHLIEIAKALATNPRVLLLDEATTGLSPPEVERLFRLLRSVTGRGTAVLYVTHHLEEVGQIGDRVTVMRDGGVVATCDARTTSAERLVEYVVGREIARTMPEDARGSEAKREVVLSADGLVLGKGGSGVSLEVRRGEVLGIYGVGQCGRTELAEVLIGARRAHRGAIEINGEGRLFRNPGEALRFGISYLPSERVVNGVIPRVSTARNMTLSWLGRLRTLLGRVPLKQEAKHVDRLMRGFRIRANSPGQPIGQLSGGNQQKALLARAWGTGCDVLVLNDPTMGIDVGTRREIYQMIRDAAAAGKAVVVASSDADEVLEVCDRVITLYKGRVAGCFDGRGATYDMLVTAALGGSGSDGQVPKEALTDLQPN